MKIAVVYRNFRKEEGIGRYVIEITKHFLKKHEVHLLTSWMNYSLPNLNVHLSPVRFKRPLSISLLLNAIINTFIIIYIKLKYKVEIVYSQGSESFITDIVVMQSCHKAWMERLKKEKNLKILYPVDYIIMIIEKYVIEKGSKKIIAISDLVKKEILKSYKISPTKLVVIHSGVNIEEFNFNSIVREQIRSKHNLIDKMVLCFVANEFKRKGLEQIIKAIYYLKKDNLNNIFLFIIGSDNPTFYLTLAAELGVIDRILFMGSIKNLNDYYSASDIFIFPTAYDAFGLVIIEAMACGLPVIISRNAGAAEIVTNGKDAILLENPEDAIEIAKKIKLLVENEGLRKKISANARKTAEKYSWEFVANKTEKVFQELKDKR